VSSAGSGVRLRRGDLFARETEASAADLFDFATALQASDDFVQVAARVVSQVEGASNLAQARRLSRAAEVGEQIVVSQFFATRHNRLAPL
jgi:hypothetical protein